MSAEKDSIPAAKVVLLGDMAIGAKTSLAIRFMYDTFVEGEPPTIAAAFLQKVVEVDGFQVKLEIWGLHPNTKE